MLSLQTKFFEIKCECGNKWEAVKRELLCTKCRIYSREEKYDAQQAKKAAHFNEMPSWLF